METKLGCRGGNYRQFIPLAKKLGLLGGDGIPTDLYKRFRNNATAGAAMAQATKNAYREIFERNEYANNLGKEQLKGLVVEITGLESKSRVVQLICQTFDALMRLSNFDTIIPKAADEPDEMGEAREDAEKQESDRSQRKEFPMNLAYTINLVLPKTDDPAVFNAIFKSLRENLLKGSDMDADDKIRLFGLSHVALERELDKLENALSIDLQRSERDQKDEDYYPQFAHALRQEAAEMSTHYELFYCLEKSIRKLVADTLEAQHGENWWDSKIPQPIRENVKKNMQREVDSAVTLRSEDEIDLLAMHLTPVRATCSTPVDGGDYPTTLLEFERRFASEEACREYLFELRRPDGFRSAGRYGCPRDQCRHCPRAAMTPYMDLLESSA